MAKRKPLTREEVAFAPVAEKRAREILRLEHGDMPLWSLLARAYIIGVRDTVEATKDTALETAIDQLVYARQREWAGVWSIDRLKLRDLIVRTVLPYTEPADSGEDEVTR